MKQLNHRRADARVQILKADGTPAGCSPVQVDQISHAFLFGCGAFDAVALMKQPEGGQREFLQDRMEKWLKLFNYGTLPFYWEGMNRKKERPPILKPWLPPDG